MNAMVEIEDTGADPKGHPAAKEAMERWTDLKTARAEHEADWEDIARLIRPQRGGFSLTNPGDRTLEKPLSSEPIMAGASFAAGIYANLTNPAHRWFGLETPDTELNAWQPMAVWNDEVTRRVFNSFRPELSSFYSATFQTYADIASFGNGPAYDEFDERAGKFRDVAISLAEVAWDVDAWGQVWEWVRKFDLKPRAAVAMFGKDGSLPPKVQELAEKNDQTKITFYHHIKPNMDWRPGRIGLKGKPVMSVYACEVEAWLVSTKGYHEMPAYVPRWDVDSGHTVGTGPGFIALASARSVHLMEQATIRGAQYAADPTLLAPDRESWQLAGRVAPGRVVYGGMNMRGERMMDVLQRNAGIGLTQQEKAAKVEEIKNAFHYAIMGLSGRTGITVEETMIMEQARLREWAPHSDRIMEEYAARKVERRFNELWRRGQLPPPPKEAQGVPLQVRYTSAAALAMKATEGTAIVQFVQNLAPLAAQKPRYLDRIDDDGLIEALHEASPSLPARILRSRQAADQLADARAQQAQQAQMMQMATEGAGALKDAAGAAAMMQPQGGGQ
jgi:hypothetical protein